MDPRIARELVAQRSLISVGLVCSAGSAALLALSITFVKWILAAMELRDGGLLMQLSGAVIALFAVKYVCTRGQTYYLSKAATRLTSDLRKRLFAKLQRLPISYFTDRKAGAIHSVLTNDVGVYQSAITVVRDAIDGPIKIVFGLATIFVLEWRLAAAALAVIPLMVVVIQRNARKMREEQASVQSDLAALSGMTQEALQGVRVVKAFGAEERIKENFSALVERSFASQVKAIRRIATLRPMVELIGAFALAIVVYLCGLLVNSGSLTVSDLGAFIMGLDVINQGFKNVGTLKQTAAQVEAAADRIYGEVLDAPEPLADRPDALVPSTARGRVEFRDVRFAYPDGTVALRGVTFAIEPGESLALVGPSGSGKSTIADLMLRFYDPTQGQILFDGIDIRDLDTAWLRAQMGVVPQQTFLFAGSIAENVRLGAPDADGARIAEAGELAHVAPFVAQMPNGYETELGERGARLSGGEMQRVAIARAVVRKPTMLLLDEATSNLDAESEKAVQEALEDVMRGRTTLFIAHRLTTAARADRILVLRRGEILEMGTHRELMDANGAYAGMVRAFSSGVLDGVFG